MYEPIRDPKWLTEAGAEESVQAVENLVATALNDPGQFLALVQPWHRATLDHSLHLKLQSFRG